MARRYSGYRDIPVLKVFGSSTCPKCADAKERLQRRKIPFKFYNVGTARGLAEAAYYGLVDEPLPALLLVGPDDEVICRYRAVLQAISEIDRKEIFSDGKQLELPLGPARGGSGGKQN